MKLILTGTATEVTSIQSCSIAYGSATLPVLIAVCKL